MLSVIRKLQLRIAVIEIKFDLVSDFTLQGPFFRATTQSPGSQMGTKTQILCQKKSPKKDVPPLAGE